MKREVRLKIIIANYRYFVAGGPERYMFNFMKIAKRNGVECIPFSVDYAKNQPSEYSKHFVKPRGSREDVLFENIKLSPVNIYKLINASIYNFEAARKLRKLIRDVKPDALYILHEINSLSPSIIRAAKKEKIQVIHRISDFFMFCPRMDFLCGNEICESCLHGYYRKALKFKCVKDSFFATLVRVFAMKLYSAIHIFDQVDAYITTCEFMRHKMVEGGVSSNKIHAIPTFIDASVILPCYENDGYFLYLGRIAEQKGIIYAIEALTYLTDLSVKLRITGALDNTPYCRTINHMIIENHLEGRIEFVGFQQGSVLDRLIERSIAVVNPAIWYENMPNTVIEAYAHGKPVIATRIGSMEEIIVHEKTGLLFSLKSSEDLARQMRRLMMEKDLAENIGRFARKVCEEKYGVEQHMSRVIHLLDPSYQSYTEPME